MSWFFVPYFPEMWNLSSSSKGRVITFHSRRFQLDISRTHCAKNHVTAVVFITSKVEKWSNLLHAHQQELVHIFIFFLIWWLFISFSWVLCFLALEPNTDLYLFPPVEILKLFFWGMRRVQLFTRKEKKHLNPRFLHTVDHDKFMNSSWQTPTDLNCVTEVRGGSLWALVLKLHQLLRL